MKLVAIDSATPVLALAAVDDARAGPGVPLRREAVRIQAEERAGGPAASAEAVPALLRLVAAAGWRLDDLDAVAFGTGPGGFTGLRTACAVAQGLAFGLGLPVVPVDSLALVAEDAAGQLGTELGPGATVWVAMDARMDEIYAGAYRRDAAGFWTALAAPVLTSPQALAVLWREHPPAVVAGSALGAFGERLDTAAARRVGAERGRGRALGWLAAAGLARGHAVPPAQALPVYVRDKVAFTTAERERARGAAA